MRYIRIYIIIIIIIIIKRWRLEYADRHAGVL